MSEISYDPEFWLLSEDQALYAAEKIKPVIDFACAKGVQADIAESESNELYKQIKQGIAPEDRLNDPFHIAWNDNKYNASILRDLRDDGFTLAENMAEFYGREQYLKHQAEKIKE